VKCIDEIQRIKEKQREGMPREAIPVKTAEEL